MLLPLALLAALAAALFVAFGASQLRPVFFKAADLRAKFDLLLLGVVSIVLNDSERRRERVDLMRFGMASGSLVTLFLIGMAAMSILAGR